MSNQKNKKIRNIFLVLTIGAIGFLIMHFAIKEIISNQLQDMKEEQHQVNVESFCNKQSWNFGKDFDTCMRMYS